MMSFQAVQARGCASAQNQDSHAGKSPKSGLLVSTIRPTNELVIHQLDTQHQITETIAHGSGFPKYPTFTPDGEWLIFSSEMQNQTSLYIRKADDHNSAPRKLTDGSAFEGQAAISRDGYIYFTSSREGTLDIYRAAFDPAGVIEMDTAVNMTKGQGSNFSPALSPDGKTLAFASNRHSKDCFQGPIPTTNHKAGSVYTMSTKGDGDDAKQISGGVDESNQPVWQGGPSWSNDGQSIIYYSGQNAQIRLYRYDLATASTSPVGPPAGKSMFPTMHPLNGNLVFAHQKPPKLLEGKLQDRRWKICQTDDQGTTTKLFSLNSRLCWAPSYRANGSLAINATTEKQASFFADSQDLGDMRVSTIRGFFPIQEGESTYAVEDMEKIVLTTSDGHQRLIFKPDSAVFGLGKAQSCNWLATTVGIPFRDKPGERFAPAHIYKVFLDDQLPINLTASLEGRNVWPTVSPDGQTIIFVHQGETETDKQLYSMHAEGGDLKQLTFERGTHTMPSFSHDGKKVVFSYSSDGVDYQVKVLHLNADGTAGSMTIETENGSADTHPCFAPDNTEIAFTSDRGGYNEEAPYSRLFFNPQPYGDVYLRGNDRKITRLTDTTYEQGTPGCVFH